MNKLLCLGCLYPFHLSSRELEVDVCGHAFGPSERAAL